MEERETICRLCLKDCDNNFTVVEENATEFVGFLLESNLSVNKGDLICANCTKSIKDCSDFKSKCFEVQDFILKRINHDDSDANDILDRDVCRLCMCSLRSHSAISIDNKAEDAMLEKIMLDKCLPELDLRVTERPVICVPCHESLQHCFGFITNCQIVEEKIQKYCEAASVDAIGLIKLKDVLEFTTEPEFIKLDRIKVEDKFWGDEELMDEGKCSEDSTSILENLLTKRDVQELKLKEEETFLEEIDCKIELTRENSREMEEQQFENIDDQEDLNRFDVGVDSLQPVVTTNNVFNCRLLEHKEPSKVKIYKCSSCSYQSKFRISLNRHLLKHKDPSEVTMYKCDSCSYQTVHKYDLSKHLLKHKDSSEVTMYKCDSCPFQTKYDECLNRHLLRHKKREYLKSNLQGDLSLKPPSQMTVTSENVTTTMYRCDFCPYQTETQCHLKNHLLIHKDSSATMYQCDSCPYQTKYKRDLKRHLLKHKDPSEITMYKCDSCPYQTKQKSYLEEHLLKHKYASEITRYKCDSCSYTTNRKQNLLIHRVKHKDPSELSMHKCDFCSYQAKQKSNLKRHLLKHEDPSNVELYKCDFCSYQSRYKFALNTHLLKHKDPSEVTMYKCDSCSYQTTHKYDLKEHLLKHKDPSEVTMYKCESCSFQTKYKKCINRHLLKHRKQECLMANLQEDLSSKSPGQMTPADNKTTTMYQCDFCPHQTKKKCHLKDHMLLHKDPSEVTMFRCDSCSFQTKRKKDLKRHLLRHRDPSEVPMYKCERCLFQTRFKNSLASHLLTHKDPSEVTIP